MVVCVFIDRHDLGILVTGYECAGGWMLDSPDAPHPRIFTRQEMDKYFELVCEL